MMDCVSYAHGRCTKGNLCKFNHDLQRSSSSRADTNVMQLASNSENAGRASSNGKATPCHFFRIGKCRYGRDCLFAHSPSQVPPTDSLSSSAGAVSADLSNSPQDPRSRLPCHDYLHGRCLNGGTCPYAHPEEAISEGSSQGGEEFYVRNRSTALS